MKSGIFRYLLSVVLILCCAALWAPEKGFAQYERPGSSAAQFLKLGVSAGAEGMSGIGVSTVKTAAAAYYNPAALALIDGMDVTFTHTEWFAGINHEYISVAQNFGRSGTFALSATGLYTNEMQVRTPLQPDGTGETFYAGNFRAGLTYSRSLTNRVTFGGTINYINVSLYDDFSEHAFSMDIASLYSTDYRGFAFGMKIANFGSNIKFVNESYPLPAFFEFGASMNAVEMGNQTMLVGFSAIKPNDGQPFGKFGVEWNAAGMLFIRGGYNIAHDTAEYTFGAGVEWGGFRVNYAFGNYRNIQPVHRFTLGMGLK